MVANALSPVIIFRRELVRDFGIDMPWLSHIYTLPAGYTTGTLESLLLRKDIHTNCSVSVEKLGWLSSVYGTKFIVKHSKAECTSGESHDRVRSILKDLSNEAIRANPELEMFKGLDLSNREMLHLLWGMASGLNSDDIAFYAFFNRLPHKEAKTKIREQRKLSSQVAGIINPPMLDLSEFTFRPEPLPWTPSPKTLTRMIVELSKNEEKLVYGVTTRFFGTTPFHIETGRLI